MFIIDYEVVVKYNGDILKLENEIDISIELLGYNYAIIMADSQEKIKKLLNYSEIEHIEEPFILEPQETKNFYSTGIKEFKKNNKLTGKGVILGVIDSGIDYSLPVFQDKNGKSKILYYWDQAINGNSPDGFKEGTLYTSEDINKAIKGQTKIHISTTSSHGTHVSVICSEIANEASIIAVKVGRRSTDFMRGIKFILDKALELKMPVAINISYGSNEGSHRGLSLFEQYIDDMCSFWKNNIVVSAGNNRDKGAHKRINIKDKGEKIEVEFIVDENEKLLNLNIWPDLVDNFSVYLVSPSNTKTHHISLTSGEIKNIIGSTKIKGYFYPVAPYYLTRRVTIQISSTKSISPGTWKLVFEPINIVIGNIDIYLSTSEGDLKDTRFLKPDKNLTVTVPGTANKVITVGSYNSITDTVSIFSGEGDISLNVYKPDILAPGEGIVSVLSEGNSGVLSGTSMAAPHVTGVVALLMEWGIVQGNDLYLYSQKLKSALVKSSKRNSKEHCPNDSMEYGLLNLSDINLDNMSQTNQEKIIRYRKLKRKKIIKKYRIKPYVNEATNLRYGINMIHTGELEKDLQKLNIPYRYYKIGDNIGVVFIDAGYQNYTSDILNLESVLKYQPNVRLALLGEISPGISKGVVETEDIGANFFKNNSNESITGKGVVIGIADTGIDYLHEDFIYPDGTSKIRYLWDQTKDGNPPKGYTIGTEYTREDINKAIENQDTSLSKDEEGHGTMISGICVGLGRKNSEYAGVAEDSELIVVKLGKIEGYYTSANLIAATDYFDQKTYEENIPIVINYSIGSNALVGRTSVATVGSTFFKSGIYTVSAAVNEGNTQTHTSGKLNFNGEIKDIELELSQDEDTIDIEIWVDKPDIITVALVSPTGEESKVLLESDYSPVIGLFDLEGTEYSITYIYPTTYSGQECIRVNLNKVKKGIWKIRLIGDYITNGIYQAYLPNRVFLKPGTKFREVDPLYTINYPATYDENITVGAYDTINNSLWVKSSKGPTIAGGYKPDIVAPGVNIIAPYPGNTYATITGTAAAAAYVSGAAALYMQYVLVDGMYRSKSFSQKIKTYLNVGAKRSIDITYPNNSYGYGILDIRGMFEQLR